jgi:hypothetical protein
MSKENSVVAVYRTHTEADQAVRELQRGGVDMILPPSAKPMRKASFKLTTQDW